jgi:hypothetical protein
MSVRNIDIKCIRSTELHVVTGGINGGEYDGESCGEYGVYINGCNGIGMYVNNYGTIGCKSNAHHSGINEFTHIMFGIECNVECEWGIGK